MPPLPQPNRHKPATHHAPGSSLTLPADERIDQCDVVERRTCEFPEAARTHIMGTLDGELPDRIWIAYHGKGAYRKGEPGLMVNTTVPSLAGSARSEEPRYWLKYMDGDVKSFSATIPAFGPGKRPSPKRDYLFRKLPDELWAEMLPDSMVRPGARIIGRDGESEE